MENKLNKKLLAEGCTPDNPPLYARWNSGWREFEYTTEAIKQMVWETPCGLLRQGTTQDGCGYGSVGGVAYRPENGNLRIGCPYFDEKPCSHREGRLEGWNCVTHRTERPYDYNKSVEKLWYEWDRIKSKALREVIDGYGYCACMYWDRPSRSYKPNYDVEKCINTECKNDICVITKKPRNLKRVNIYYDILRERHYKTGMFELTDRTIEKGVKKFDSAVACTDAEMWLKQYGGKVFEPRLTRDDRRELFFSEHHGKQGYGEYEWCEYKVTPQNIRIESRASRDLLQDLRDAQEGIEVVHASDLKKQKKEAYRERKAEREAAKKRRVIKNLKRVASEGINQDGEQVSDKLIEWSKTQLKRRGLAEREQVKLF